MNEKPCKNAVLTAPFGPEPEGRLAGRLGGNASARTRRARQSRLDALRQQLELLAPDAVRVAQVDFALSLYAAVLRAQNKADRKHATKRPDSKSLAAATSAFHAVLESLGAMPEQPGKQPKPPEIPPRERHRLFLEQLAAERAAAEQGLATDGERPADAPTDVPAAQIAPQFEIESRNP